MHGIGHHEVWSALGSPPVIARPEPPLNLIDRINPVARIKRNRQVSLAGPPEVVAHDLILVNWSRMSRNGSALIWFIAFPFTLINMAYEMQPSGGVRRVVHVAVVAATSVVLTAVIACWATAIAEAMLRILNLRYFMDPWRPLAAVMIVTATVVGILLFRPLVERESRWHVVSAFTHAGVVAAIGAFGYLCRPSEWIVPNMLQHWVFSISSPAGAELERLQEINAVFEWSVGDPDRFDRWVSQYDSLNWQEYFDPIGSVAAVSLMVMVVAAAILVCTARRSLPGAAGGSALAIVLAFTLTTLTMSVALNVLMPRLESTTPQIHTEGEWGLFGEDDWAQPYTVWLGRGHNVGDSTVLLPALCLLILASLGVALVTTVAVLRLWLRYKHRWVPSYLPRAARKLARIHLTVRRIGPVAWWASALTVMMCLSFAAVFPWYAETTQWCPSRLSGEECDAVSLNGGEFGLAASGIVAVLVLFVLRRVNTNPAFKARIEAIADIAGFWPIAVQPLAARSYRPYAVTGISDAVLSGAANERTVLVGHSQGSVLAAWAVATCPELTSQQRPGLTLATCGSPLRSLYATFFPRWFDDRWFANTRLRVNEWHNFWRETDPIAIPLHHKGITDVVIPDPRPDEPDTVRGHSDYWIAPEQKSFVATQMNKDTEEQSRAHAGQEKPVRCPRLSRWCAGSRMSLYVLRLLSRQSSNRTHQDDARSRSRPALRG